MERTQETEVQDPPEETIETGKSKVIDLIEDIVAENVDKDQVLISMERLDEMVKILKETGAEIQVQRMYRFESDRPLKAFADIIINDALLIKGIKVLEGKNGLFVSMPQEQAKDRKWYDSVRCLTQEIRDQITEIVLSVYKEG